jgi:hypothetical protein
MRQDNYKNSRPEPSTRQGAVHRRYRGQVPAEIGQVDRFRSDVQLARHDTNAPACDYLGRKRTEGKSRGEAIRCLERLLIRAVYQTLKTSPALTQEQTPGQASALASPRGS